MNYELFLDSLLVHCKNDWVTLTPFGHLNCKSTIVLCNSGNQKCVEVIQTFLQCSCVCTARRINVAFNRPDGLACCPIALTCNYTLELPMTYSTFSDFSLEFQLVLKDDDFAWVMDAL